MTIKPPGHKPVSVHVDKPNPTRRSFIAASALSLAIPATALTKQRSAHLANANQVWDTVTDVLVVGGGAAGCVAAATARANKVDVILCEKAGTLGGTSAKSGGAYWIPNNFDLKARGINDSRPDFLHYVARYSYPYWYQSDHPSLGLPTSTYQLLGAFYDHADDMVQHMAALGALRSTPYAVTGDSGTSYYPDYLEHIPENRTPRGRVLVPQRADGTIGAGNVLMQQLTTHLYTAGVEILVDSPVIEIIVEDTIGVTGVVVKTPSGIRSVRARRGVIFCSGGYSHNPEMLRQYQRHPVLSSCAIPTCTGDFITLGSRIGAQLGNMTGAWRAQCLVEQALLYRSLPMQVWYPIGDSMFVVNKYGKRIFNESRNYHDRTQQTYEFDASTGEYPNLFNFPIYDRRTAERFAGNFPLPPDPLGAPYIVTGHTLAELADNLGQRLETLAAYTGNVRLAGSFKVTLEETYRRFNKFAKNGHDPEYGRGSYPFDREVHGFEQIPREDTEWAANPYSNPVMHPLSDKGPYYTMILGPAVLDTNGGPQIDATGAVLDTAGQPIAGLFGAGNCIASAAGNTYWGAGATLGSAMTFGYIAARSTVMRKVSQ